MERWGVDREKGGMSVQSMGEVGKDFIYLGRVLFRMGLGRIGDSRYTGCKLFLYKHFQRVYSRCVAILFHTLD